MVGAVLRAAGYRVGQTPKPHLVSYRERIVVDGRPIAAPDFTVLVEEALQVADRVSRRLGPPTEFEILTTAALLWFTRQRVDLAVVEVGLGGRLDATNAWDGGVASITNVERDHMDILGSSIGEIAREKAAIIKRGDYAVTGATGEALAIIRRRAMRVGAPLTVVDPLQVVGVERSGTLVVHPDLGPLRLGLLGRHQAANAAVALATIGALEQAGMARVDPVHVANGLRDARWPGRLELLELAPDGTARAASATHRPADGRIIDVVIDGAHNVAGAQSLADALTELQPSLAAGRAVLLLSVLRNKEVEGMAAALASTPMLRDAVVIATTAPYADRARPAGELEGTWRTVVPGADATTVDRVDEAFDQAIELARSQDGPLIVAGSLYLVGAVRARLIDDPDVRDPQS
jgi:dihydrofolate synthase/folylpolyglutamate synthase